MTAEGEYTLVIPAKMILEITPNEEDEEASDTIYSQTLKYDFTISYDYVPVAPRPPKERSQH